MALLRYENQTRLIFVLLVISLLWIISLASIAYYEIENNVTGTFSEIVTYFAYASIAYGSMGIILLTTVMFLL